MTEDVSWPIAHVGRAAVPLWQCVHHRWTGQLFGHDGDFMEPVATIQTTIGEVADGIKAIYRMLRTEDMGRNPA
jgi:hypothetical protein